MKHTTLAVLFTATVLSQAAEEVPRPPSVPLVACDPYFSIWSPHNKLTDGPTTHWTGKEQRLECSATIDGRIYRILGGATDSSIPALPQTRIELTPTRTIATFAGGGVSIRLTFTTPALPGDLEILSRPVTYLTFDAASTDDRSHRVAIDFAAGAELATNLPDENAVTTEVSGIDGLTVLRAGSTNQQVLAKSGDDIRIDWGYLYLAAPTKSAVRKSSGSGAPAPSGEQLLSLGFDLGTVGRKPASRWLMLAYDDLFSIQYMGNNLRPFWRRNGWDADDLLRASAREYESLRKRCAAFDTELTADLRKAGGDNYAYLGALAYRQCFAAGKFVADRNGQPLQFSKENHSNGCMATSDVFYPMSPQFLLFGPSLAKSFIVPFMNYAASERWTFPFAPHDLGTYPHANGQRYGGGERSEENQMPVEESGNLLVLFAAVAQMEGHADFAGLFWPQLSQWAEYLKEKGFDPENQLCTDDFAGHLAHNVNLSVKAICGLASYARLCALRGEDAKAREYGAIARQFAKRWVKEADDGDHYRLAFDRPGTWSQKYNLVWDKILDLGLFPDEVRRKEMDHYLNIQNEFGLPLDNRRDYTKLDWVLWTATLTRERRDFDALLAPVCRFLNESPDRSPMTDWYETKTARKVGFTARPVVGGIFLEMLYHRDVWTKYAARDVTKSSGWAPMPKPPVITPVVPNARHEKSTWRFTTDAPAGDWSKPAFDDASWRQGTGGFGSNGTPGAVIGTKWTSPDIWIRRDFQLPAGDHSDLQLEIYWDEDCEVFINGAPAVSLNGYSAGYVTCAIGDAARKALRTGTNTIAIHCHQTQGGQFIDAGLVTVRPAKRDQ